MNTEKKTSYVPCKQNDNLTENTSVSLENNIRLKFVGLMLTICMCILIT